MAGRIFLANVGANASHRFTSPVFPDGTFEFIPIPEDRNLPDPQALRYRDLSSFYDPERDLREYIPRRLLEWPTHSDPEFVTFTYGDNCEASPRAASLKRLEPGDFLFFITRLEHHCVAQRTLRGMDRKYGFYLIGFLEIEEVLGDVRSKPDEEMLCRFGNNAHVRRGLSDPRLWDGFWVFGGSARSRRFRKAVPVSRGLADRVFTAGDGSPWRWPEGRTELQVIGSYTRSCRCVIDPALPGHAQRAEALWAWVQRHAG